LRLILSLFLCQFISFLAKAQAPFPDFTADKTSGCSPLTVTFTDQSTGSPQSWNWSFNGQLRVGQNPGPVAFTNPGTYSITLTVRNANGINSITKTDYITVNPSPSIAFTADKTVTCLPVVINFTDHSVANAGNIVSWLWKFNTGTNPQITSTQPNPSIPYNLTGYYDVYLKVTSSTGCTSAVDVGRYIRIVDGVKANFSYSGPPTCDPPFVISYKNLTSGPGNLTYNWDLGNSTTSTQPSPAGTYTSAGNYPVNLIATSDFGCTDTIQNIIPVNGSTTSFQVSGNNDSTCLGTAIIFQSTSTPTPASIKWDFGDGTTYTGLTPPPKTYAGTGIYNVVMTATYATCTNTATKTITVFGLPTVDFSSANNNSFCQAPAAVVFQNLSPDVVTALWDFGDKSTSNSATTPVNHSYISTGSFPVTLTITDSKGCSNKISKPAFVNILPPNVHAAGIPVGLCKGQGFSPFFDGSTVDGIASYSWDFGDGSPISTAANPSYSYSVNGNYTVKLTILTNGGCTASFTSTPIQVGDKPVVDFSESVSTPCRAKSVAFTNLSIPAGQAWHWSFGDTATSILQNPSHKFRDTGLFSIKLTVTNNGCIDSTTKNNFVQVLPPLANFGYTIADCTTKSAVTFSDSSKTNPADGLISYLWNFGNPGNNTSTAVPPLPINFTYPGTGTYNATLIVNNGACADTAVKKIMIVNETPDFTLDKAVYCRNDIVVATSVNPQVNIKRYGWIVDGKAPVNGSIKFPISFGIPGNHSIRLVITDINGCIDSSATKSFVVTGPTAKFSLGKKAGGCSNSVLTFSDSSIDNSGTIIKWVYNFNDGTPLQTFTAPPFTHTFATPGTYAVNLTVFDNGSNSCSDTYTLPVIITKPVTKFNVTNTTYCPGTPLQFVDSSSGKGLSYLWNFGDGTTDTIRNPLHTYPSKDGIYTVKLIIADSIGCSDSLTLSNYINIKSPKATYTVKDTITLCPPLETKFNFTGTSYQSFEWDFGDGSSTSTLANTSHFYNDYGKFTAKLYVTGFGGCRDSASINISVTNPYTSTDFTYAPALACNNLTTTFTVTKPFGSSFVLYFGDGGTTTNQDTTFTHFYSVPNQYSPLIVLKDSTGCQIGIGANHGIINVKGAIPLFGADKKAFCDSGTVYFADYSQQGADPIVTKTWDFGDGSAPVIFPGDAIYDYTKPGLYVPKLLVTTAGGCMQTYTDTIRVLATPQPVITGLDGICKNSPVSFTGSLLVPPDTAITWKWDLGNGQSSGNQNVALVYPDAGPYHITLNATNSLGCKGDTAKDITIYPLPSILVNGDTSIISGSPGIVMPITYSANASTFNWSPAINLSCTDCANPFVTPKFTTTYKVNVADANGCLSSRDITIIVTCNNKNFFIPNTFSPNNDGANDVFYPRGKGLDLIQALRIFNRWGELVFEKRNFPANDAASGWDGSYKGRKAPSDTYIYMIDIICDNATIITYKGNITLIR
jgi:gliding motility-associated-like protein